MGGGKLLVKGVNRLVRIGVDAVFPLRCWQCEALYRPLENVAHPVQSKAQISFGRLMAPYICPDCAGRFTPVDHPLCPDCGRPYQTDHGVDHTCPECLRHPMAFTAARAAGAYDQPLKTLIHHYKYQGRTELALPFGKLLWRTLVHHYDPMVFDLIIPVPLHWYRRYRRGFNQAALLLRNWPRYAADAGVSLNAGRIADHVLVRRRPTSAQPGLDKHARAENQRGAFVVPRGKPIDGRHILLVDDVLTTGATAAECSKALLEAGAAAVDVLTLARAV